MKLLLILAAVLFGLGGAVAIVPLAEAQSSPNFSAQILTHTQLNQAFQGKVDVQGGALTAPTISAPVITGGTITGATIPGVAALDGNGGIAPANVLDSRTNLGLINPQQLPHWRAALATMMNTTTAPFVHPRIMMMIDSTTMGENSLGMFTPKNISYWLAQDLVAAGIPANNNSICGGSVANRVDQRGPRQPYLDRPTVL